MTAGVLDDADRLAHFRLRVLADALIESTADYWNRRALVFEEAAPRPGDFTGRATPEDLAARRERCLERAAACRARASLEAPAGFAIPPLVLAELAEGVRTWE